ncbi:MAG TPA: phosphopantetheine-binding protein, partial [Pilimelia sp.]|nr:phosphopantetheine-binding protein [Pilimelia sp.]
MRRDVADALDEPASSVGDDDDLLRLGLDSIGVMRLAGAWRRRGVEVTFAELVEWRTLAQWWELVAARLPGGADGFQPAAPPVIAEVDESAPFPLATMQHAYWVGRADGQPLGGVGAHFYVEFDGTGVDPARLETAVRALLDRHAMLRAAFDEEGRQRILPASPWPGLTVYDLRDLPAADLDGRLAGLRDELSHRRLDAARAEVFDVRLSLLPGGATRTHVHIEMLVADAHSFRV